MNLSEQPDARILEGSLVAVRYYNDEKYAFCLKENIEMDDNDAYHVVLIKKPNEIREIIEKAEDAFWVEIVKAFPEVQTGDFPPDTTLHFNNAMMRAVTRWLDYNYPQEATKNESG